MQKSIFRKGLVYVLIILFVGTNVFTVFGQEEYTKELIAENLYWNPTRTYSTSNVEYANSNGYYYIVWTDREDIDSMVEGYYAYSNDLVNWNTDYISEIHEAERAGKDISLNISDDKIAVVTTYGGAPPYPSYPYPEFCLITGTLQEDGEVTWNEKSSIDKNLGCSFDVIIFDDKYFVGASGDWDGSWRSASIFSSQDGTNWQRDWEASSSANYGDPGHFQIYNDGEELMFIFFHDYDETDIRAVYYDKTSDTWQGEEDIGYDKKDNYHPEGTGSCCSNGYVHFVYEGSNEHLMYGRFDGNTWSSPTDLSYGYDDISDRIYTPQIWEMKNSLRIIYQNKDTGNFEVIKEEDDSWEIVTIIEPVNDEMKYPCVSNNDELTLLVWSDKKDENERWDLAATALFDDDEVEYEEDLVGYWNFDEGSGSTAYDSSDYNNHGTIYGASWTTGVSGNALEFDGVDDYVDFTDFPSFTSATWTAWINPRENTFCTVIGRWDPDDGWQVAVHGNKLRLETPNNIRYISNKDITVNKWIHIAVTADQENVNIFIDGSLDNTLPQSGDIRNIETPASIGTLCPPPNDSVYSYKWYYNGIIDDVRVYNYALTADEVEELYNTVIEEDIESNNFDDFFFDRAMYIWGKTLINDIIKDEGKIEDFINFCTDSENNIYTLFLLATEGILENPSLSDLIEAADKENIHVHALAPGGIQNEWGYNAPDTYYNNVVSDWVKSVTEYNNNPKNTPFSGIHLDIELTSIVDCIDKEPGLCDNYVWEKLSFSERSNMIENYLILLYQIKNDISSENIILGVDIGHHYDNPEWEYFINGVKKPLSNHVMDIVDFVTIMDYTNNNNNAVDWIENAMSYANENNKNVVVAFETQDPDKVEEVTPSITFWGIGREELNNVISNVKNNYPCIKGFAIHKYESYKDLPLKYIDLYIRNLDDDEFPVSVYVDDLSNPYDEIDVSAARHIKFLEPLKIPVEAGTHELMISYNEPDLGGNTDSAKVSVQSGEQYIVYLYTIRKAAGFYYEHYATKLAGEDMTQHSFTFNPENVSKLASSSIFADTVADKIIDDIDAVHGSFYYSDLGILLGQIIAKDKISNDLYTSAPSVIGKYATYQMNVSTSQTLKLVIQGMDLVAKVWRSITTPALDKILDGLQNVAGVVDFVGDKVEEYYYDESISIDVSKIVTQSMIKLVVDSKNSAGKTVIINIAKGVFSFLSEDMLVVTIDGNIAQKADDYNDVIDPSNENVPEFFINNIDEDSSQIIISFPSFSSHTIDFMSKEYYEENYKSSEDNINTPGFELLFVLLVIVIVMFWERKKRK